MNEEIFNAIRAAGTNPAALQNVALMYGLDPAFVASVASGTSRTTMGQSFDPSLLVAAGIISPDVLSQGMASASEAAYQEALRNWNEDRAALVGQAPQFVSAIEYDYGVRYGQDHPIMNLFAGIRNGMGVQEALNQMTAPIDGGDSMKQQMIDTGLIDEGQWSTLEENLKDYATDVARFNQQNYEFMLANDPNSPQYQAGMASLGAMPTRETFDTSQARLDYAKALGMPALALLPDPNQPASVTNEELRGAVGGSERFQSMLDLLNKYTERGTAPLPADTAPTASSPIVRAARNLAETSGMAQRQPSKAEQIRQMDLDIGIEQGLEFEAGLNKIAQMLASKKPNPFQQALGQYGIFGALEANV
jgi:hypothetical protein